MVSLGGAKGGSVFDPKGKSDNEIRRCCTAFMRGQRRYIGANADILCWRRGRHVSRGWMDVWCLQNLDCALGRLHHG